MQMVKRLIIATTIFLACLTLAVAQVVVPPVFANIKSIAMSQSPDDNGYYIAKRNVVASGTQYWACYLPTHKIVAIVKIAQASTVAIEYWEDYNRFALYQNGDRIEITVERAVELANQILLEANGMQ